MAAPPDGHYYNGVGRVCKSPPKLSQLFEGPPPKPAAAASSSKARAASVMEADSGATPMAKFGVSPPPPKAAQLPMTVQENLLRTIRIWQGNSSEKGEVKLKKKEEWTWN